MKKIRRINLKLTAALITMMLIIIASCTDDIADKHKTAQPGDRTITLRAAMPQDNSSTRIALEESEGSLNLIAKWKEDDVIQLFYVQNEIKAVGTESTVFNISEDGKTSSFNITVPEEIDLNEPFDLYFFCGIPEQGVQLIDGEILADITPMKSVSLDEFSVPVWTKVENISLLTEDIELTFSHLGAYEVIHLKNESSQNLEVSESYLIPENSNSSLWYHHTDGENSPVFNPVSGNYTMIQGETTSQSASQIVIEPGTIKTIISWYVPNGEIIPEFSLKMNETVSDNSKDAKDFAMQSGRAYHIYAVWDGIKLTITDDDYITELPKIVLTTSRSIGSTIELRIDAAEEDKQDIWVDLNNNGIREEGEDIVFEVDHNYTIQSQTVTVYGKVTSIDCGLNQLTSIDVTKNKKLEELWCDENQLTNLDVTNNEKLKYLSCYYNQLTSLDVTSNEQLKGLYCTFNQLTNLDVTKNEQLEHLYCPDNQLTNIDVTKNKNLEIIYCSDNQLTNLDVTNNPLLEKLYCDSNQLSSLDVSNNPLLETLDCVDNPITCIKVSQAQLNNIPFFWHIPSSATYSLNCN